MCYQKLLIGIWHVLVAVILRGDNLKEAAGREQETVVVRRPVALLSKEASPSLFFAKKMWSGGSLGIPRASYLRLPPRSGNGKS